MHPRPQLEEFLHLRRVGKREPLWAAAPLAPQHSGSLHRAAAGPTRRYSHGIGLATSMGQAWSSTSGLDLDPAILRVLPEAIGWEWGGSASHIPPSALCLPALSSLPPIELRETLSAAPQESPEVPRCSCKVALKGMEIRLTLCH